MIRIGSPLFAVLALLGAGAAHAGNDTVTVTGGSVTGVATINIAAGNINQQANAASIATGGMSSSTANIVQLADDAFDTQGQLATRVAPGSFAGSSGWLAINGVAGSGNQQANLAVIALGTIGAALSDTALSQAHAPHEPTGGPGPGAASSDRSVAIGGGAFANSSGLIQVNLIGGDRNSSANILTLSDSAGANQ